MSSSSRHTCVRIIGAALAVACVTASLIGCVSKAAPASSPKPAPAPEVTTPPRTHGAAADMLTRAREVPLSVALSKSGINPSLPDSSVAGPIQKVILDDTALDDAGRPGLIIMYPGDIVLWVTGSRFEGRPVATRSEDASGAASTESSVRPIFETREFAGRTVRLTDYQTWTGSRGETQGVLPRVSWSEGERHYSLTARSIDVTLARLLAVLESIK